MCCKRGNPMREKLSILLLAALLLGTLAACQSGPASQSDPKRNETSSSPPSAYLGPDFSGSGSADSSEQPAAEPEREPVLEFDPGYALDIDYPKVAKGALELPVRGATGYASVQLPLWESIPEPKPETEPEPEAPTEPENQTGTDSDPGTEDTTQPDAPSQPDSSSQGDDPSLPDGASNPEEDPSASSEQEAAPVSPLLPDLAQDGADSSQPATDPTGDEIIYAPDDEIIYAPGEEPLPEVESEPEEDPFEGALAVLDPGTAFTVLEEDEEGSWWLVECRDGTGWIENRYCLINLPDVIPSMVYNATNSYDSQFRTLGRKIPNVTGQSFYPRGSYNYRLERNEFMMPVLYTMSKHICQAQQAALAQGNTLVLYEGYRPHEVQTTVYKALTALSRNDSNIKDAVASAPWNISWFIAGGYSNHQRGFAIDVTLARINRAEIQTIGGHQVLRVREYEEYTMPTPIHELSKAAATYTAPVASHSPTAWKSATMTDTMANCPPALALQRYCTDAGLTPLASEWWHFNDLKTRTSVLDNLSVGGYKISTCLSTAP